MSKRSTERRWRIGALILVLGAVLSACATAPRPPEKKVEVDAATRAAYERGVELMRDEDYEEAIAVFRNVIERNDALAGPYVNIGIAQRALGEAKKAQEALTAAIDRDPANGAAYNQLGLLHRHAGRFQEARRVYSEGIDENPDYARLYRNLGILCDIYLQDPSCALENFRAYSERTDRDNEMLERWIADVERRVP